MLSLARLTDTDCFYLPLVSSRLATLDKVRQSVLPDRAYFLSLTMVPIVVLLSVLSVLVEGNAINKLLLLVSRKQCQH